MRRMIPIVVLTILALLPVSVSLEAQEVTGGYHEVVIVTKDRSQWTEEFAVTAGWQELGSGTVDGGWLDLWGVDKGAEYTLLGNPGTTRGYIRLIEFGGEPGPLIRPNDQAWDVGGIFDFNMRVTDMERARSELMAGGWSAASDPVQFSFGPFVVKEWIPRGPDSVRIAVIERVSPALEGWPYLKKFSRAFNATMVVAATDIANARHFWMQGMGFKSYLEHRSPSKDAGPNVLGIPYNLATEVVRDVSILHPDGKNEGSIELLAFEGATGADFANRTAMPNRGIARLRFPVKGLQALADKLSTMGYRVSDIATGLPMTGIGTVNVAVATAPGGSKIELFEKVGD